MKIIFETDRLIVREWQDEDCNDLYEYASDAEVTKYLSFPTYTSLDVAKNRIEFLKIQYTAGVVATDYCIEHKKTGKVIGSIGIISYKEKNYGQIEIGYVLNPKFQGQGFMTECLKGMFMYVKANKLAKRITGLHDVANPKSGYVMERAGMTKEGILRKAGKNNFHTRCDLAVYSILDEEISMN